MLWMQQQLSQLNPNYIIGSITNLLFGCKSEDWLCHITGGNAKINNVLIKQGQEMAKYFNISTQQGLLLALVIAMAVGGYQIYHMPDKTQRVKELLAKLSWLGLSARFIKPIEDAINDAAEDAKKRKDKLEPLPPNAGKDEHALRLQEEKRKALERMANSGKDHAALVEKNRKDIAELRQKLGLK